MNARILEKIEALEQALYEFSTIRPVHFEDYQSDIKTKAACEHYFEKIIESTVDIAFLIIKERELAIPEDDKQVFDVLTVAGIINESLRNKLKDAKGMRNIIVHQYGQVDDKLVFSSITQEIEQDAKEFLAAVRSTTQ